MAAMDDSVLRQAAANYLAGLQKGREVLTKKLEALDAEIEKVAKALSEGAAPPALKKVE